MEFLRAVAATAGAGAAVGALLSACGGGSGGGGGQNLQGPSCRDNGAKDGVITANHGHVLHVPSADVIAGVEKTYNIQGVATHPHSITIRADQFSILAQNGTFTVTSTFDADHTHDVTVICI